MRFQNHLKSDACAMSKGKSGHRQKRNFPRGEYRAAQVAADLRR